MSMRRSVMARARSIKPSILKNELLGEADPMLTILFAGLWMLADRRGRLEDRPKRIKAEIFPYREALDINGYLTVLERLGFICRYNVDNVAIIQVINFEKHQHPHKTEKESELPEIPKGYLESRSAGGIEDNNVKEPLNNGAVTEVARLNPESLNTESLNTESLSTSEIKKDPDATPAEKYTEEDLSLAKTMGAKIVDVNPSMKNRVPRDYGKWADTIRLMRERDCIGREEISETFDWANANDFWSSNILSPGKLREKYATLRGQIKRDGKNQDSRSNHSGFAETDYAASAENSKYAHRFVRPEQ